MPHSADDERRLRAGFVEVQAPGARGGLPTDAAAAESPSAVAETSETTEDAFYRLSVLFCTLRHQTPLG